MFRWYKNAAICYAFLSDVLADDRNPWDESSKFSSSRWFERDWTLQELLAPPRLRFYNCNWHFLGTKGDLCTIVERCTGIPSPHFLSIGLLRDASVAQRMSWAAKRVTKRPEDIAYSLLGIFGITMPMIYGEGSTKAFSRLQELIMREIGDDSILAWGLGETESTSEPSAESLHGQILASSPADFAKSGHIQVREHASRNSFDKFGGSLRLHVPLLISEPGKIFCLLKCGDSGQVVGIPLINISKDAVDEYIRPQGCHSMLLPKLGTEVSPTTILVRTEHENRALGGHSREYWLNVQGLVEAGLELTDVEPRSCWRRREEGLIEAAVTSREHDGRRTFVRFRHKAGEAPDFLVVLEVRIEESEPEAGPRCNVMTCARDTSLAVVAGKYNRIRPEVMDKQSADNGLINLKVVIEAVQGGTMFFLRTVPLASSPDITYDVTVEFKILDVNMEMTLLQEEESATNRRATTLGEAIQEKKKSITQMAEDLELVKRELSVMEASKARLVMRLEEGNKEIDHLKHSQSTSIDLLQDLEIRRLYTQRCLESFLDKAIFNTSKSDGGDGPGAESGLPILSWAAQNGHLGVVRGLFDMGVANTGIKSGLNEETALHLAARYGHYAIALMLLDYGVDMDSRDGSGETPLSYALRGKNKQLVSLLVERGADLTVPNMDGRQPLHLAAIHGIDSALRLFLENGANIDTADQHSRTALHEATAYSRYSTTKILLNHCAAVNVTDKYSQTPLHLAVMKQGEVISKLLIKSGANVDAPDNYNTTPLHLTCSRGFVALAELLVQEGASVEARMSRGVTPLHSAVYHECEEVVELLVKRGASMATDDSGASPLHWAASIGNETILKTLLESGDAIPMNQLSDLGNSPLDHALRENHEGAASLLSSYGATRSCDRSNNGKSIQAPMVEHGAIRSYDRSNNGKSIQAPIVRYSTTRSPELAVGSSAKVQRAAARKRLKLYMTVFRDIVLGESPRT